MRQALVATATLLPYTRRRRTLRLVVGLIASFVLAGALTGGTIATASQADASVLAARIAAANTAKQWVHSVGGTMIGRSWVRSATGSESIQIDAKPAGANRLVQGFACVDPGHFVGSVDGKKFDSFNDCSDGGSGSGPLNVSGGGGHTVAYRTQPGVRYVVWLSWASIPEYKASAAQTQALRDGTVTRSEELAAYYRFEGCMDTLGHAIPDRSAYILPLSTVSNAELNDGSLIRCEVTQFSDVDGAWRHELADKSVGTTSVAACDAAQPTSTPPGTAVIVAPELTFPNLGACLWIG